MFNRKSDEGRTFSSNIPYHKFNNANYHVETIGIEPYGPTMVGA